MKSKALIQGAAACAVVHGLPTLPLLASFSLRGPDRYGPLIVRGARQTKKVALTFDDGPATDGTPRVLDALSELGLVATFFVLGEETLRHPGLVAEIASRGHEVALHGMHHQHHLARSPWRVSDDLRDGIDALASVGITPGFFRPPYGQATVSTILLASRLRLRTVLWSSWGHEWQDKSATRVGERVVRRLHPGAVVLLHDSDRFCGKGSVDAVLGALPTVAASLHSKDLRAVQLTELIP